MKHRILLQNSHGPDFGRLTLIGEQIGGLGVIPRAPLRVYGSYGMMLVTNGVGRYVDSEGRAETLVAGDAVLVFPELAHHYGPPEGSVWNEIYAVFGGPVFDLWRQIGMLNANSPILRLGDPEPWARRLATFERVGEPTSLLDELCEFLKLLGAMVTHRSVTATDESPIWIAQARAALASDLSSDISWSEVADRLTIGQEKFRKRFTEATGVPPAQYRERHRLAAARELLLYTQLSHRQIADQLGFRDEFYFSRRFKHLNGISPSEFRRAGPPEA